MQAKSSHVADPEIAPGRRARGRPHASAPSGEELRELIVSAAAQVYATQGYHGTSVEQIIQAAATSRPTFYRYFSDRYEVLDVVIARVNDDLKMRITGAISGAGGLEELLESVVDAYFEWGRTIGPIAGAIYREIYDQSSPASTHRLRILNELMDVFLNSAPVEMDVVTEPLLYEAAMHVVEHLGHQTFWPEPLSEAKLQRRRSIILQALRGMLEIPRDTRN